jgi:hypothetical protein
LQRLDELAYISASLKLAGDKKHWCSCNKH